MARLTMPRSRLRGNGDGTGQRERMRRPLRRSPSILDSFNFALEGIIHVLRTHRNMRVHFAVAILVLVAAVWVGVSKLELIALLLAIAFVRFGHEDVVRHKLVQRIVEAYRLHAEETGTERSR